MVNKRLALMILCGACTFFSSANAASYPETAEVSEDEVMSYFPKKIIANTLEKFNIPQAQRLAIQNELADKDQEVVFLVEEKAAKMDPNPLRDPKLRQEAVKIFRDSLYEIFSKVMQTHGVTDKEELHSMLNDIQRQKAENFSLSIENQKQTERHLRDSSRKTLSRKPQGVESY